ncbi:ABC transporter ATP-binding protein [Subtercola sp. YIM 133946]|uniref:ABC transporter ATP-binding protein n=1 Tax=Subtercola sp. YIM 133946 TaxID=3118909 RepID=UPI002F95C2FA
MTSDTERRDDGGDQAETATASRTPARRAPARPKATPARAAASGAAKRPAASVAAKRAQSVARPADATTAETSTAAAPTAATSTTDLMARDDASPAAAPSTSSATDSSGEPVGASAPATPARRPAPVRKPAAAGTRSTTPRPSTPRSPASSTPRAPRTSAARSTTARTTPRAASTQTPPFPVDAAAKDAAEKDAAEKDAAEKDAAAEAVTVLDAAAPETATVTPSPSGRTAAGTAKAAGAKTAAPRRRPAPRTKAAAAAASAASATASAPSTPDAETEVITTMRSTPLDRIEEAFALHADEPATERVIADEATVAEPASTAHTAAADDTIAAADVTVVRGEDVVADETSVDDESAAGHPFAIADETHADETDADETLADETFADETETVEPVADKTFADETFADETETVGPEADETEVVEPQAHERFANDRTVAEPVATDGADPEVPTAPNAALSLTHLVKRFGSTIAVDGVDLEVQRGGFYGIVGPNGAGKTTTLSMITGLVRPDEGVVRVDGHDVWKDVSEAKRMIGVLPDKLRLFDRLTGRQLLHYSGSLRGLKGQTVRERSDELAEAFGIQDALNRLVSDYSAGMTKKVALAASMIHSPRLLVLDEPFESVDPVSADTVTEILQKYVAAGGTVVLSSHSMDMIERVCDGVAIIVHGRVLSSGSVDQVRNGSTLEDRFIELAGGHKAVEGMEWLLSSLD